MLCQQPLSMSVTAPAGHGGVPSRTPQAAEQGPSLAPQATAGSHAPAGAAGSSPGSGDPVNIDRLPPRPVGRIAVHCLGGAAWQLGQQDGLQAEREVYRAMLTLKQAVRRSRCAAMVTVPRGGFLSQEGLPNHAAAATLLQSMGLPRGVLPVHQELRQIPDIKTSQEKEGLLSFWRDLERLVPLSTASGLRPVLLEGCTPPPRSAWRGCLHRSAACGLHSRSHPTDWAQSVMLHSKTVVVVGRLTLGLLCKCRMLWTRRAATIILHDFTPLSEVLGPALRADTHTSRLL